MKKQVYLFVMLFASVMMATAQKSDREHGIDVRSSKPYHFINIRGEMNVKIIQDTQPGVSVEGSYFQQLNTITLLKNDTLYVYQVNVRRDESKPKVVIRVNDLMLIEAKGRSKIICSGFVSADYLKIRASEGAQIKLDVRALKVESIVTGDSSIILEGTAVTETQVKTGHGVIDISSLQVINNNEQRRFCPGC